MLGMVKEYDKREGFGFIEDENGNKIFVHFTQVRNGIDLENGQIVKFDTITTDSGLQAINVMVMTEESNQQAYINNRMKSLIEEITEKIKTHEENIQAQLQHLKKLLQLQT